MRAYAIYGFFIIMFAPAGLMFTSGAILIPMAVAIDLRKGHFESMLLLLPLIGGGVGLVSALALTTELAGNAIAKGITSFARAGLFVGIAAELVVYLYIKPESAPTIMYWLPPLFGAVILFAMSFTITAYKQKQADA